MSTEDISADSTNIFSSNDVVDTAKLLPVPTYDTGAVGNSANIDDVGDVGDDGDGGNGVSRKTLTAVLLAIAIVLILVILYHMVQPGRLAKSLAHRGWIVYYRPGCGYCTKQKQVLGGKFKNFIECDTKGNLVGGYTSHPELPCNSPIIKGFPFWYNTRTKKFRTGLQDTSSLEKMAH